MPHPTTPFCPDFAERPAQNGLFPIAGRERYHYATGMSSIHIRDIEPATLAALKRLARNHHRSLQGELRFILGQAARLAPMEDDAQTLGLVTVRTGHTASWSRDDIYGADGR